MEDQLQEIVDALSVRLGRPVLVDDVDLRPLAYSSQFGELDSVRTASILGRGAPDAARDALFAHGIRTAVEPVRIPAHPAIGMEARACIPILRGNRRLGFLWLIEDRPLDDEELRLARAAASEAASMLESEADSQRDRRRREQDLLAALLAGDGGMGGARGRQLPAAAAARRPRRCRRPRGRGRSPARPRPRQARAVRRGRRAGSCGSRARASSGRCSASARAMRSSSSTASQSSRPPWPRCGRPTEAARALGRPARRSAPDGAAVHGVRRHARGPATLLDGSHEQLVLTLET